MNAATLIQSISSISDEDEYKEHLASKKLPSPLVDIIHMLNDHLGDDIQFSVSQSKVAIAGRISGDGLALILKNGTKFLKWTATCMDWVINIC